jgi:hypothetical protein
MKKIILYVFLSGLLWIACDNPFGDFKESNPVGNLPPETHLFLFVEQEQITEYDTLGDGSIVPNFYTVGLDTTPSKQILHWWGDDPDGEVVGYYYKWDYQQEPVFTTQESDTFFVPIRTSYDEFSFQVWAVDDQGIQDPSPRMLKFPVFNSPPNILFRLGSNPRIRGNPNVTSYTFPTRTFVWDVSDPDGRETIVAIRYALDDTTNWMELPGEADQITLTDLSEGEHRFFVKAVDVSGAESPTLSFPDPGDDETPNKWVVKPVQGDILLVNDFAQDQNQYQVQGFYSGILDQLVGPKGYSVWEIGSYRVPAINPENSLPYSSIDIQANLGYFDKVIWFSHLGRPNLTEAGLSITRFVREGGKIFITNGNEERPDTTWTFTRIDSVYRLNPGGRLLPGLDVLASFGSDDDESLDLNLGQLVGNRVSALLPGSGAEVVYRMQHDSTATSNVPYSGSPAVGVRYRLGSGESIYFSLPLHYCDGNNNLVEVFRYILFEEFAP